MVDIARLGLQVDATQPQRAVEALNRLTQAGRRAEGQAARTERAYRGTSGTLSRLSNATREAEAGLAGINTATRQASMAATRGQAAATAYGAAWAATSTRATQAAAAVKNAGRQADAVGQQMRSAAGHTGNLAAQFNDIGVMLASGQSPLTLALQQGTQVSQVLNQMGGGAGAVRALGAAFASVVSPVSLLTIGVIAGGAALAQWGIKALQAGSDTRSLADATEDLEARTEDYRAAAEAAAVSIDDLAEKYGERLAPAMRQVRQLQAEIEQGFAQTDLDAFADTFTRQIQQPRLGGAIRQTFRGGLSELFELGDAPQRLQNLLENSLRSVRELVQEYDKAAGNVGKQLDILDEITPLLFTMSGAVNDRSKAELELLDMVNRYREAALEVSAIKLDELTVTASISKEEQRRADWAERTLERLKEQTTEARAILQFGNSAEAMAAARADAARRSLEADIDRREVADDMADILRAELEARLNAEGAVRRQTEAERQRQEITANIARAAEEEARATQQRQAEAERARQRLAAEQQRILERQQRFYEQRVTNTINSLTNAWAEYLVDGMRDFKSFTQSILNLFKRLLAQMIAEAAARPILLSMGIGGMGGAGGLLGGGGGMGGGMFSGIGKLFGLGGGGGQGGGFFGNLKSLGQSLGLIHGPAIAGGGAAALASGAATSAAFGFGPAAGLGAGGLGAGGGAMAATGLTGLGVAAGIAGGVALLAAAFKKHKEVIAEGINITVDGLDTLGESFKVVKTTQFFGLKKTIDETISPLAEADLSPIRRKMDDYRNAILSVGETLGIGASAFDDFTRTYTLSFQGLSEAERQAALDRKLAAISQSMAAMAVASVGLNVEAGKAHAKLAQLASDFTTINAALRDMGRSPLRQGARGAIATDELSGLFGGAGNFAAASMAAFEAFVPEAERMEILARNLTETFASMNMELPKTREQFRIILDRQDMENRFYREQSAVLLSIAPQLEALIEYENRLAEERREAAEAAAEAAEEARQAAQAERERAEAIRQARADTATGIFGRFASHEDQVGAARGRLSAAGVPIDGDIFIAMTERIREFADAGREWASVRFDELAALAGDLEMVLSHQAAIDAERIAREAAEAAERSAEAERRLAEARERAAEEAARLAEQERQLRQARLDFQTRISDMVFALVETPEQALARRRDALLSEASAIGAPTDSITNWYNLQLRNIRETAQAQQEAEREAQAGAVAAFEARTAGMVHGLTDTPLEALNRQLDTLIRQAVALGASTDHVFEWYTIQYQRIQDQARAQEEAERTAAEATRTAFEAQALARVHQLTDTPEQALARERDRLIAEGIAAGADTGNIVRWYELSIQAIREEADARAQAEREAEEAAREQATAARQAFEARAAGLVFGLTDTPIEAAARQRDALIAEAETLSASTQNILRWYELTEQNIIAEAEARAAAEAEAAAEQQAQEAQAALEARQAFEERTQAMFHRLTDSPLEAANRQRDQLLEEAAALEASTDAIIQWYEAQAQAIQDLEDARAAAEAAARAAAQQRAADREAAAAAAAAERRQRQLARQFQEFYNTFYSREERVADAREELTRQFDRLRVTLPETRQEFRELVESTRRGSSLHNSLLGLAEQFAFITDETTRLNEALGGSQQIFRDLREEVFAQTAQSSNQRPVGTDGVSIGGTGGSTAEIVRAIYEGDINLARHLIDIKRELTRESDEPTTATVPD